MQITQRSSFLLSMVQDVAAGRILPVAMQRPYVWRKADVEALCDSILSEFPIGAFLLWAPGPKADLLQLAKGRLGPVPAASNTNVEAGRPYGLLLDGQNRLATLAWMLEREPVLSLPNASDAEQETWLGEEVLVLDGESRSIRFVPRAEASHGLRLPAWTVVASASREAHGSAMQLIRACERGSWSEQFSEEAIDDFIGWWGSCCDSFRDARTTETVIENATAEEARHAFLRICRVGVPMAQADFDTAIGWQPASGNACG
jgi:hypothetical protein